MITSEVIIAYAQCKLKAYLLFCSNNKGNQHEYISILEDKCTKNREHHFSDLKIKVKDAKPYSPEEIKKGTSLLFDAKFTFDDLEAYADILTKSEKNSTNICNRYIPTIVIGTYKISKDQKLLLAFSGYLLSKIQNEKVSFGTIITNGGLSHTIKLEPLYKEIELALITIRTWSDTYSRVSPPIILNSHCSLCPFLVTCELKSIESDHLSLLNKISTKKQIEKFERKGIFTVNQLSYLYRPRRQRKRSRKLPTIQHSLELQALVLRVGKIYLHSPPELSRKNIELFLDIEGIPDRQSFYLMGLIVCEDNKYKYIYFWADDTETDEKQIWSQLISFLEKYRDYPIYHYGSYETKAIETLGKRYKTETKEILKRLINVNNYIYGKVYFPLRSNSLKEIGQFIGATWSAADASGLQSLVWRHYWEVSKKIEYKQKLTIYNNEDCQALKLLVEFLSVIKETDNSILDIDCFVHSKKSLNNKVKNPIHQQLESILKFAHADYDKNKINFSDKNDLSNDVRKKPIRTRPLNKYRKVTRIIEASKITKCKKCGNTNLQESRRKAERIKVDLIFSKNSIRKSIIKYVTPYTYCNKCLLYLKSNEFSSKGRPTIYDYGFKIWIVYQRVSMRLPYRSIIKLIEDTFNETLAVNTVTDYLREVAHTYNETEELIIKELLASKFLHVDETQVNIDNINQYVWVFTDGKHVFFKYTKTRDASFIQEFLSTYEGVLISDFYPGYDILKCRHQKCLVHIIRDMNNDLWSNPFDDEFGKFVHGVRDLLLPIMDSIQKYGLKKRHLSKFKKVVEMFYLNNINNHSYKSSLCSKYQDRLIKYRESLFTFLGLDDIPWHNNPAENALRAIILQLEISLVLHASVIDEYLVLLSIKQTCKYQNKSFLKFLLSKEKHVDLFKDSKLRKPL
jgi:predicted RecB family nuclease